MTARRFFAWVWRLNALVVLALGLLGFAVLVFAAGMFVRNSGGGAPDAPVMPAAAPSRAGAPKAVLEDFIEMEGAGVMRAALRLQAGEGRATVYSKAPKPIQNYLYYDPATQATHWLIPAYQGIIVEIADLP